MFDKYKTIYLDFDNTIVNTTEAICTLYNEDFCYYKKFKPVSWYDIETWCFKECSCATKEYINTYFNQPRFFEKVQFIYYAKETIEKLAQEYNIKIVSMGYKPNLRLKKEWIKKNLPGIDFIGVNLKKHKDKCHIDMSNGVLIDDNVNMLITSNAQGKICFGETYKWNEEWTGIRAINWVDVGKQLLHWR